MKFPGHWVATQDSKLTVTPDVFDETELTQASNWSEAHQNDNPDLPHGYIDAARVIAEVASRWLATHPEVARQLGQTAHGALEINTLEDFGRLCLWLAPSLPATRPVQAAAAPAKSQPSLDSNDTIPLR